MFFKTWKTFHLPLQSRKCPWAKKNPTKQNTNKKNPL